jgi:hypothetical protein
LKTDLFCDGRNKALLFCVGWLAAVSSAPAAPYVPGQAYFGRSNYIEYIAGDMPVIFSAPHGGALTPAEIPDRARDSSDAHFAAMTDSYTEEVALTVEQVFRDYFGHCPHVVICRLKRTKLDCNRGLAQSGAGNNAAAIRSWTEFQDFIELAGASIVEQNDFGFYIDLHGQKHPKQRLELGYLLTAAELAKTDAELDGNNDAAKSSIRRLSSRVAKKSSLPFSRLLRGPDSFGGLMTAFGFPSVPSPAMPAPGEHEPYFDGGYNVAMHASRAGGRIDGLQIEANMNGVRDTAAHRASYALAIARTLDYFFTNYYGLDLRLSAPCLWKGGSGDWAAAANWGGTRPVAGNYLVFTGPGGVVNNNLPALTSGSGTVYSLSFATNAAGSYSLGGNPISLRAGVTNLSSHPQEIGNNLTLLSPQTFSAATAPLRITGHIANIDSGVSLAGAAGVEIEGVVSGGIDVAQGASLTGRGNVAGMVSVAGTIAPGNPGGALTLGNGLKLEDGGAYRWTLAANRDGDPGTNFSQILLTHGSLAVAGNTTLTIAFTNCATAPTANDSFWRTGHSWKIISLGPAATNPSPATLPSVANADWAAGKFIARNDAHGNVWLDFVPARPLVTSH